MSNYYGSATLEDWLAEEIFNVSTVPPEVVALFEQWREAVEQNIESWMDSDDGDGRKSWRQWGFGMDAVDDMEAFRLACEKGQSMMGSR